MDDTTGHDFLVYLRKSKGRKAVRQQRSLTLAHVGQLGGRVAAEFRDDDQTAFRKVGGEQPKRDGFTAMLATLRARPGLRVAAWHADRLTRNDDDTTELLRVCAAGGHLVTTATGGTYDLSTANGRRRLRDDASAAIYEVDHGRERTLAGRAEVAADGRWLGGKRPFGWELDPAPLRDGAPWLDEDGKPVRGVLRLREDEAAALAQACRGVVDGVTLGSIARDWNERGILTFTGKRWRANEVRRVLVRPRNAGLMEYQGEITGPASWPPVIDETTLRAAAAILSDPRRRTSPGPGRKHLLSWLARCGAGECEGPLICTSTSRAASRGRAAKPVYRCREGDAGNRGHVQRDQAALDGLITRLVIARLSKPDAATLLAEDHGGELAALRLEAEAIRVLMREANELRVAGLLTMAEFADGRREHQDRLAEIEARMPELGRPDVLAPLLRDPAGVWEERTLSQKRAAINALMTIRVLPATRKGRPPGWRPGEPYFDPETVEITWRKPND